MNNRLAGYVIFLYIVIQFCIHITYLYGTCIDFTGR